MAGDYRKKRSIMATDENGADTNALLCTIVAADPKIAAEVISADDKDPEGRSPWLWVRLQNGDLLLACFPQGDTYLACEADPNAF